MEQTDGKRRKRMRDRKAAVAAAVVFVAVLVMAALYFGPLISQRVEGPSAEMAVEWADRGAGGHYAYALEREYADGEGRTVYRLVSDSQPVVILELRYGFRWFPELSTAPGAPMPSIDMPGPYYELVNEDEWRKSYLEWNREQMRQEAENGGSLRTDPRRGGVDG